MFFSHLLNRPTSVFTEPQKPSGRKKREADRQEGQKVGLKWERRSVSEKKEIQAKRWRGGEIETLEEVKGSVRQTGNPSFVLETT